MATREENLNKIREQLAQADNELNALSDAQLEAIAGGKEYVYGSTAKFPVGELVNVYIPVSGFVNSILFVLLNVDTSTRYSGAITGCREKDGKWVYDIMTKSGEEHFNVDEQYITVAG